MLGVVSRALCTTASHLFEGFEEADRAALAAIGGGRMILYSKAGKEHGMVFRKSLPIFTKSLLAWTPHEITRPPGHKSDTSVTCRWYDLRDRQPLILMSTLARSASQRFRSSLDNLAK